MIKQQVMEIVEQICNTQTNCRGIVNNVENINALFTLKGIDTKNIRVYEVPIHSGNQVLVLYKKGNEYRQLFAGIGNDGKFYFEDETDENGGM